MIKALSAVIILFLLIQVEVAHAQGAAVGGIKTYSGYFYQKKSVFQDKSCSIEFKSPVSFSRQAVSVIPEQLSYFVRFKNAAFQKFLIKIYANDGEEYSIDPDAEGRQVGINDEHHIADDYLIYLILGTDIHHLEIVSPSGDAKGKYVLDKLEIRDK